MSKASEWAALSDAPKLDIGVIRAEVERNQERAAVCAIFLKDTGSRRLKAEEILALARWIIDTFGETP